MSETRGDQTHQPISDLNPLIQTASDFAHNTPPIEQDKETFTFTAAPSPKYKAIQREPSITSQPQHPSFYPSLQQMSLNFSWEANGRYQYKRLRFCQQNFIRWKNNVFGNSEKKIQEIEEIIADIHQLLPSARTRAIDQREKALSMLLANLVLREESHWAQKANTSWHQEGDDNTKFFHMPVIINRQAKNITTVKDKDDDLVLFGNNELKEVNEMVEALKLFCQASGHQNNFEKSDLIFSAHATREFKQKSHTLFDIKRQQPILNYLGSPTYLSRVTSKSFSPLLLRLQNRLRLWKASTLSQAGRVTLINAICSAIPNHQMGVFKLPEVITHPIDVHRRAFLWGHEVTTKKVHSVNWKRSKSQSYMVD
ncbi:hypothetical protein IFM89_004641 [Coptis chinensis]|uniref:Reverse transcriptase n=1 Tax=Coptis chinensis TaxID=261450 RepID=A0A835H4H0_9MAGN|nr:hypothetical protein IFM89_004641 [Coptis chinensis]